MVVRRIYDTYLREHVELVLHRVAAHKAAELQLRRDEVRQLHAELVSLDRELAGRREDHRAHADRVGVHLGW